MSTNHANDPRIDPRIKAILAAMPSFAAPDVKDREAMLAQANQANQSVLRLLV
jgi:hypothetical protein